MTYDVIIIGAGLYGLYSAELIGRVGGGLTAKRFWCLKEMLPLLCVLHI